MAEYTDSYSDPWERMPGEPKRAYQAFLTYLRLGPSRSVPAAYQEWSRTHAGDAQPNGRSSSRNRHPVDETTTPPAPWKRWRVQFKWYERAAAYDERAAERRQARVAEAQQQRVEERLTLGPSHQARMDTLRNRLAALEKGPLAKSTRRIGSLIFVREPIEEYKTLSKELRALEDRYFALTESVWEGGAKDDGGEDKGLRKIAGTFTVGDRMYDGSDPPPFPQKQAPPGDPEEPDLDLSGMEKLYPKKD